MEHAVENQDDVKDLEVVQKKCTVSADHHISARPVNVCLKNDGTGT